MNPYKWFSLKNYKPSKDPSVWANHIFHRLMMADRVGASESNLEPADLFIKYLYADEKPRPESDPDYSEFFPTALLLEMNSTIMFKAASEQTVEDHEEIKVLLDYVGSYRSLLKETDELGGKMGSAEFEREKYYEKLKTPISDFLPQGGNELYLKVLVSLDDETIITAVLDAVRRHRRKLDTVLADLPRGLRGESVELRNRPVDGRDFNNWYLYRVLPYYDLVTWSNYAGVKLTLADAHTMLWRDGFGNAETIRKTTKKYVATTISWSTYARLKALQN